MLIQANSLHIPLKDESVQCIVTSPPYWGLRDYGVAGQLGLEKTPDEYIANMVQVFRECHRVLKSDGVMWVNFGDSFNAAARKGHGTRIGYKQGTNRASAAGQDHNRPTSEGLKPKDLVGIPWMLAFALRADGWYLRQDIIWHKPNPMPESVKDRCTKAHEYVFLLTKSQRYYWDQDAVKEPATYAGDNRGSRTDNRRGTMCNSVSGKTGDTRNLRSVWTIQTQPTPEAHFATFPEKLVKPCILAGSRVNDTVFDPFGGSGTVGLVAHRLNRKAVLCELSKAYLFDIALPKIRLETEQMRMF